MYDDGVSRQGKTLVSAAAAGEDIFHVIHGEIHLVMTPFNQFGKADVELRDVAFAPLQHEFVAAGNYFEVGKIGAEFGKYLVSDAVNLNGVDGFQLNGFLHTGTNIRLLF